MDRDRSARPHGRTPDADPDHPPLQRLCQAAVRLVRAQARPRGMGDEAGGGLAVSETGHAAMTVDIGERLRFVRMQKKMSQRSLAKRAGVTNSTISLIESNQVNP